MPRSLVLVSGLSKLGEHLEAHSVYCDKITKNKCRPILVQGLRRDIEINFHIDNIYGSVAQLIECSANDLKVPGLNPGLGEFFHLNSF